MAFLDVLRQKWIARNPLLIALVGFGSSLVGTGTAFVVFPENVGLMGLAFAALIMMPFVSKLLSTEETRDYRKKRFSRRLFSDHSQTFKTILLLFFGIFAAYVVMGLYINVFRVKILFAPQLEPYLNPENRISVDCTLNFDCYLLSRTKNTADLRFIMDEQKIDGMLQPVEPSGRAVVGSAGLATQACEHGASCFFYYLSNNIIVLLIVLLLSCFYGAGAMLYLAYNASTWGTVFAFVARETMTGGSKIGAFSNLFVKVFPHTFLEASAYLLAVIAGVVIMKALLRENSGTARFKFVMIDGILFFFLSLVVLVLAAFVEAFVY
ncbi:MAG: stage II sporulation protein M [Candidatus Micrarchaeota archaeon]